MNSNENYIEELNKKLEIYFEKKEYKKALEEIQAFPDKKNSIYLYYLALIKNKLNQKKEALEILNKLTKDQPKFLEAFHLLANINEDLKKYEKSKNILEHIVNIKTNDSKAKYNLARIYQYHLNKKKKALELYKQALDIDGKNYQIWNAIGNMEIELKEYDDALDTLTQITKKFPDDFSNLKKLAEVQLVLGLFDMSEDIILRAIKLNSNQNILNLLALCYLNQGRYDESDDISNKVINYRLYNDEENIAYKRLLISKVYQHDCDHKELIPIFEKYNKDLGRKEKIEKIKFKKNKKIRIGFVSSEFRKHAMNNLIHALFVFKDKKNFEYYCYSSYQDEDEITEWYKKNCDSWKDILPLNDKEASSLIRSDNIDVLIFLGGIDGENRYLLSGYRSAPKQVSFHPITSSYNETMDYWISDNELHPINFKEKVSEKIIRIKSHFNFPKPENLPEINEAPMKKNKYISFSSFSNPRKISNKCLELWTQALKSFENSKLYLRYYEEFNNKSVQNKICNIFEKNNISKDRIFFFDEEIDIYLRYYNKIDIGLDTFPYSGSTTTYAALTMGVPVITLTGNNYISRFAASVLSGAGLSEWIVRKESEYIKTLKKLVNYKTISNVRSSLRKQLIKSPLCNGQSFSKNFANSMKKILKNK